MFLIQFSQFPLEIQDLIVAEIVHNFEPPNRIQFSLASKHCAWLVKRAKPPKLIRSANVGIFNFLGKSTFGVEIDRIFKSDSLENSNSFFKNLQIVKSFELFVYGFIDSQKLAKLTDAIRFVKKLKLSIVPNQKTFSEKVATQIVHIFAKLVCCRNFSLDLFDPDLSLAFVEAIPCCIKLELLGEVDDRILDLLTRKISPKNPLRHLQCCSNRNNFTFEAVENFLKNGYFDQRATIRLWMKNACQTKIAKMLSNLKCQNYRPVSSSGKAWTFKLGSSDMDLTLSNDWVDWNIKK